MSVMIEKYTQGSKIMNYRETLEYVDEISSYGSVLGLDNIIELCKRMGNPQDSLHFVHIAGTNGKGSTLAYISTILKCAGMKVGRYISPTIFEYRECIQVNGRPITKDALCEGMTYIKEICQQMVADGGTHPTRFEIETALAFWYFLKKECDIVVLETGMGGETDATNLITTTEVAVLTSIAMDHMQFLGNTLSEIARKKAGILKSGCQVVALEQMEEATKVLCEEADKKGCKLRFSMDEDIKNIRYGIEKQRFDLKLNAEELQNVGSNTVDEKPVNKNVTWKNLEIHLAGKHQIQNAAVAVKAVLALRQCGYVIDEKAIRKGLAETEWEGRFSVIAKKPLFVVDGAHNEDAAQKLAQSIEFYFKDKRIIYILGILKDKEYKKIIDLTHHYADQIITITPPNNPRAMHAYDLAQEVAKVHPNVTAVDSLEEAVEMSRLLARKEDVILAFGSLSYLGQLISIVKK